MALGACAELEVIEGREGLLVIIDNESEPGAWAKEMRRAPWAFGQRREPDLGEILVKMRAHGLDREADVVARLLSETKAAQRGKT